MAIALDQNLGKGGADTAATTVALTTTATVVAGTTITLYITWFNGAAITLSSVADNHAGGTLTWNIDKQGNTGNFGVAIISAQAPAGLASGTVITGTYSASSPGGRFIAANSWTGMKTSGTIVDGTPPAEHADSTPTWVSGSYTITDPGSVIIGLGFETDNLFTSTPTSPAIELQDFGVGGSGAAANYRLPAAIGSFTVGGTWSGTTTGGGSIAVAYLPAPVAAAAANAVQFLPQTLGPQAVGPTFFARQPLPGIPSIAPSATQFIAPGPYVINQAPGRASYY